MKPFLVAKLTELICNKTGLPLEPVSKLIEKPKNPSHGDLAFPCFLVAKAKKENPASCAAALAADFPAADFIAEVTAIGPFLNFKLKWSFIAHQLLSSSEVTSPINPYAKQKILLEYSSPNIAKPFHVGHLRATLIGNALDNIFRFLQADVESINHLGDWGTQFGFVWAGCQIWGKPADESVDALVEVYRKASKLKKEQEDRGVGDGEIDVNQVARDYFQALERKEIEETKFWQWCRDLSLSYLKKAYTRLGVSFDHYLGESFYEDKLDGVREKLENSGVLQESRGAQGVELGEELGFARILTPDGRSLYLTRDLAAVFYREATFNPELMLYVVGAPQALHFSQLRETIRRVSGEALAEKIAHIPFGHVAGMSTREGQVIELSGFLDEAARKALEAYRGQISKKPDGLKENEVAEAVSLAAIFFSTLNKSRIKDVEFSWKHSLEFQGDTGPYVLYAYARLNGIFEKAKEAGLKSQLGDELSSFEQKSARELLSCLIEFEEAVIKAADEREPSHLCLYTLNLAKAFSRAYNELKVVGEEKTLAENRLKLFEMTHTVLAKCLKLLGLRLVDRM